MEYSPGSAEAAELSAEIARQRSTPIDVPLVIGGQELKSGVRGEIRPPHDSGTLLGTYRKADRELVLKAIDTALAARAAWAKAPWQSRAAVFLKAAELLSGKYRHVLNAATMLGQSKSVHQAEIDSACELVDYFRFNAHYMRAIYEGQPELNERGTWNRTEYRPLEGFVFALTPFNFTAIAGNLPTAPALMGNAVVWKPASSAVLSGYYITRILREAGLPDGVVNFVPGDGGDVGDVVLDHPALAGLHFTGSTATFNSMWLRIARNIEAGVYRSYPRIVGETGGKNFCVAHQDCDVEALSVALFRGAFEYQGQKCSATSRAYIPASIWPAVRDRLRRFCAEAKVGDPTDFSVFLGAVIDRKAYKSIVSYIEHIKERASDYAIVAGGGYDDSKGWFIEPTIVETVDPKGRLMAEEVFGPILCVYVYEDERLDETLELIDATGPYALTGSIFARDRSIIDKMAGALGGAAGNLYINDKSTGAIVGQQPFGGARLSGTNDKAGSGYNLLRWTSLLSIKENFSPPRAWGYPHLGTG